MILVKSVNTQLLDRETSLFYLRFLHYYHYQNELLGYIFEQTSQLRVGGKLRNSKQSYSKFSLHSDILTLQDFYSSLSSNAQSPNEVLHSLHLAELSGLPIDIFDLDTDDCQ